MNVTVKGIIKNERDNAHVKPQLIGLFTHNRDKAENKLREMSEYYKGMVEKLSTSVAQQSLILSNGITIKWIKPTNSQRGYRCHGAIIDMNVSSQAYNEIMTFALSGNSDNIALF